RSGRLTSIARKIRWRRIQSVPMNLGSSPNRVGNLSDFREHTRKDFQSQVFFVTEAIGSSLENADFVVESFDEAQSNLVFGVAIESDAVPVILDHLGELFERLETLPFEG